MKNVIKYYYELVPENIHQVSHHYRFQVSGNNYFFQKINTDNYDYKNLYDLSNYLLKNGIYCHKIISNVNGGIVTVVNNNFYILLKILIENNDVNINDIMYFSRIKISDMKYKNLERSNWFELWTEKVDFIEYQVSQLGKKYPIIRNSINYYIGLAENSISLLRLAKIDKQSLVVSHRRIGRKTKSHNFYNPVNFILDSRTRDLGEFYKESFFDGNLDFEKMKAGVLEYNFTTDDAILFFARMLFPTYYFDCYQRILLGEEDACKLLKYISKVQEYQSFINSLYTFLRQYYNIPEVEWIIKT